MPKSFYNLTFDELTSWLAARKEKPFRATQIMDWACQKAAASFDEMTNLAAPLREALAADFALGPLPVVSTSGGHEATKLLVDLPRGGQVECVRIKMGNTYTACLSTQVGCNMACVFCATGQTTCERSLKAEEMIAQVVTLRAAIPPATVPISNVVFMGMGEPFMNYANLVTTIRRLTDKRLFGMSPSRITVSTVGIVPAIRKYAHEGLPTELTISLNAPNDALRHKLMPGSTWTIAEILDACREYTEANHGQPVTFAYVLIAGVNDLLDHARELAQLLRRQPHHVNVIPLNPVAHTDLHAPDKARTKAFVEHCGKFGLNVSLRHSKGAEVDAACGQLKGRVQASEGPGA